MELRRLVALLFLVLVCLMLMASSVSPAAYNLIQNAGSNLVRRSTLNFINGGCVDNSGTQATDCTFPNVATSNYTQSFTSQTSVALTHNLNTLSVITSCYDASTPPVQIFPNTVTITDANTVTVTFSVSQSGKCIVNGSTGAGGGNTTFTLANASSTGTTLNKLAKLTGAPSTALITATTDTGGAVGIVTSGAGTTGNATITFAGSTSCVFDGATTAGDYVQISSTVAGDCHDTGAATYPTSNQVLGRILSTNGSGGTFTLDLFPSEIKASTGGGGGGSVTVGAYSSLPACSSSAFLYFVTNSQLLASCDGSSHYNFKVAGESIPAGPLNVTTDFTFLNSTTETWTNSAAGPLLFTDPSEGATPLHLGSQTPPTAPYTLTAYAQAPYWFVNTSGQTYAGVYVRNSGTGRLVTSYLFSDAGNGFTPRVQSTEWNNFNSCCGSVNGQADLHAPVGMLVATRIVNDGAGNLSFQFAQDGINFTEFATSTLAHWVSTIDDIGIVAANIGSGQKVFISFYKFVVTTP